jgi:hypothetical protein
MAAVLIFASLAVDLVSAKLDFYSKTIAMILACREKIVALKNCVQHRVNVLKRHKSAMAKSIAWIRRMKQLNLHVAIKINAFQSV